jgi:hypothetical protein
MQPAFGSQRLPGVQVAGLQVESQVFVVVSQKAPLAQVPPAPQVALQRPSLGSHDSPPGHRTVVQSGRSGTHWREPELQAEPWEQSESDRHPFMQVSAMGSQYCPAVQPVIEQSGGGGLHWPDAQIAPKPQSPAMAQPATHAPPEQCEP